MTQTTPAETPAGSEPGTSGPLHVSRVMIAWAIAAVFGVLVTLFVHGDARFSWLSLAIGVSALVTFALQLGTAQKDGFITRTAFSIAGSVVIIAVIAGVGALLPNS